KPGLEGEVTCISFQGKSDEEKNVYVYKKGREVEWRRDSAQAKLLEQYAYEGDRKVRHGERIDYVPGTNRPINHERYNMDRHEGLQETFYENGKPKEKSIWVRQHESLNSDMQVASVNYDQKGAVSHVSCSKKKEQNPDPKLCVFGGETAKVETADRTTKIENGKVVGEESAYDSSGMISAMDRGITSEKDVTRRKREVLPDGRTKLTDLYASKVVRRAAYLNAKGRYTGDDKEYYPDGQLARETKWGEESGQPVPIRTHCLYQNGKDLSLIERKAKAIEVTQFYDDGKKLMAGSFDIGKSSFGDLAHDLFVCTSAYGGLIEQGVHTTWAEDGSITQEATYEKGILVSRKQYQEGKLVADDAYFPDGSRRLKK
ncbi:MAG: hypothetical protein EOP11_19610, partial [Proteobacteria bacterium]